MLNRKAKARLASRAEREGLQEPVDLVGVEVLVEEDQVALEIEVGPVDLEIEVGILVTEVDLAEAVALGVGVVLEVDSVVDLLLIDAPSVLLRAGVQVVIGVAVADLTDKVSIMSVQCTDIMWYNIPICQRYLKMVTP